MSAWRGWFFLWLFRLPLCSCILLEGIKVVHLFLQQVINQQFKNLIEMHHVGADNPRRELLDESQVITLPSCKLLLSILFYLSLQSTNLPIEQFEILLPLQNYPPILLRQVMVRGKHRQYLHFGFDLFRWGNVLLVVDHIVVVHLLSVELIKLPLSLLLLLKRLLSSIKNTSKGIRMQVSLLLVLQLVQLLLLLLVGTSKVFHVDVAFEVYVSYVISVGDVIGHILEHLGFGFVVE